MNIENIENQTFDQINEQISSAYRSRSDALPSVLIQRSGPDGRITVGNLEPDTRNVLFTENGQNKMHPSVSLERLTDEHQAKLAEELAGRALRSAGLETSYDDLLDPDAPQPTGEDARVDIPETDEERASRIRQVEDAKDAANATYKRPEMGWKR